MNFDLTSPCKQCPFRTDVAPFLRPARVKEICQAITFEDKSFICHKTANYDDSDDTDEPRLRGDAEQHCAGAMIFLDRLGMPNQAMRSAYRLGLFDPLSLKPHALVYASVGEMVEAYRRAEQRVRRK